MSNVRSSLAVTYYDPEAEPVPEPTPEPVPEPTLEKPKQKKRAPSKRRKRKKKVKWFNVWRSGFWATISVLTVFALFQGVKGYLGQSAAYIALSVSVLVASFLLDRDWKKMRGK